MLARTDENLSNMGLVCNFTYVFEIFADRRYHAEKTGNPGRNQGRNPILILHLFLLKDVNSIDTHNEDAVKEDSSVRQLVFSTLESP